MDVQVNGAAVESDLANPSDGALPLQVNGDKSLEVATSELHIQDDEGNRYDAYLSENEALQDKPTASTGYVYDTRMLDHWPTIEPDENEYPHPEQPARISKIYLALRTAMCFKKMLKISTRFLEKHEAMLVHSEDHWDKVEAIASE
jgi:histone deacetylase 6